MIRSKYLDSFVSRETSRKLDQYHQYLMNNNQKMSLISKSTEREAYIRHYEDSAQIIEYISNQDENILDIGTGSGCIIISIIKERENCKATAIDKSLKALKVAKLNAEMHHVQKKIKFLNIDVDKYFANKYDLIVSNPPYIKDVEILSLDKDVKLNEPKLALSGGKSGLNKVFKVIKKSEKLLKTKGKLILEIGDKQSKEVKKYLIKNNFNQIQVFKDLSRKDRCIVSTKAN